MRPGENRAVTMVGILLVVTITVAGVAFLLRVLYPGHTTTIWVVVFALFAVILFTWVLLRAMRIGTEDKSMAD